MTVWDALGSVQIGRGKKKKIISWEQLMSMFFLPPGAEFLPPGYWDKSTTGVGGGNSSVSVYDPSKHKFLWKLLSDLGGYMVRAIKWQAKNRTYIAFIIPGKKTGRKLALVEADWTLNRLYVFNAEASGWYNVAQMEKENFRPRNKYKHPEFIAAMNHNGSFRRRLIEFIENY